MNATFWSQLVHWGIQLLGRHPSPAGRGKRPSVEALEDRALLSAGSLGALPISLGATPAGRFTTTLPRNVLVADFNSDRLLDLAISHPGTGTVSIHLGLVEGTFAEEMRYPVGTSADDLMAADVNGDSLLDLVATNLATSEVVVLLGRGDGTFLPGSASRGQDADPVAGAARQLVADSGLPALSFASGEETLSPATDFAPGWEGQVRGGGAPLSSTSLPGGSSVNVPGVGDRPSGEGMSPTPGAEGPLSFAPLPLATSEPLSWENRGQVPDLLPLRDSTLAVVGTLLSVRQEESAAAKENNFPALPAGNMLENELPGAVLSRFVSGQEEALENRPALTREELLRPVEQPPTAPAPGSSAGLDDDGEQLPREDTAGDRSQAGLNAPAPGAVLVACGLACGLIRAPEVGSRLTWKSAPLSLLRRGSANRG
jgi:hypothetical protein